MTQLRDSVKAKHDIAKTSYYTQLLLSGKISKFMYSEILHNHLITYSTLEQKASELGVLEGIEDIQRTSGILRELINLDVKDDVFIAPASYVYADYIKTLSNPKDILAHMYVRHLNLIQGGPQMKKVIPFSGEFYEFENPETLKENFLNKLDDSMIEEACRAFDMIAEMFRQLEQQNKK